MTAVVYVTLRTSVLDPQGQAVHKTLGRLGFDEVADVRVGKYIELALDETDPARARERAEAMCRELLANPVVEDYRVEIRE
ncbi:MAG: phosphoribosylformylglycinamidine synthase subunit PurS [Haliangiales bacterium]